MRILIINPNTTQSMTDAIGEVARKYARPGTTIDCISPAWGPRSIEGYTEDFVAAVATLEEIARRRDQYDAFIIACYGDPGLFAAREIADVPVIGIAEASMHMACLVAHKFSIVTVLERARPLLEDCVRMHGLWDKCASIRTTPLSVLQIEQDWDAAERCLLEESRRAIEQDGAEAICLGCAGMGPLDERLQAALGVPVFDGTSCAVKLAESLYDLGRRTSKVKAFMRPEPKEYVGTVCSAIAAVAGSRAAGNGEVAPVGSRQAEGAP